MGLFSTLSGLSLFPSCHTRQEWEGAARNPFLLHRGRLGGDFQACYTGEGWEEVSRPATQGKAGRRFPGLLHRGRLGRVD